MYTVGVYMYMYLVGVYMYMYTVGVYMYMTVISVVPVVSDYFVALLMYSISTYYTLYM